MFERFTEAARMVLVHAQDEARMLRHNYLGSEHLLLALLHGQDSVAAGSLASFGLTAEAVRTQVARAVGTGNEAYTGQLPFTPRAKGVLEGGLREAVARGSPTVGAEHLLLALAREDRGIAAEILRDAGATSERIRDAVAARLAGEPPAPAPVVHSEIATTASGFLELEPPDERERTLLSSPTTALVLGWVLGVGAFVLGLLAGRLL